METTEVTEATEVVEVLPQVDWTNASEKDGHFYSNSYFSRDGVDILSASTYKHEIEWVAEEHYAFRLWRINAFGMKEYSPIYPISKGQEYDKVALFAYMQFVQSGKFPK